MEIKVEINVEQTPIEEERKDGFTHAILELHRNNKTMTNDESMLKAKIKAAETLYEFHNQASDRIFEKIMERKMARDKYESSKYCYFYEYDVTSRDMEIAQLQCALYDLYGVKNLTKAGASRLLSPLQELDEQIPSLHYCIQHGCKTIAKEKHLIREIKEAKKAREKLVVDAAVKAEMSSGLGSKEAIEDRIKCLAAERDRIKKTALEYGSKNNHLWRKLEAIDNDITSSQRKLDAVDRRKDDIYRSLLQLRRLRDHASCVISG